MANTLPPAQEQIERLELAIFKKEIKPPSWPRGEQKSMVVADLSKPDDIEEESRLKPGDIVDSAPAKLLKTPDGRILWLSVWRNLDGSRDRTSLTWLLPKDRNDEDFADLPEREDFATFEESGKLVIQRHYLEIINGLGRNAVEMAVTQETVENLHQEIEGSVLYDPWENLDI